MGTAALRPNRVRSILSLETDSRQQRLYRRGLRHDSDCHLRYFSVGTNDRILHDSRQKALVCQPQRLPCLCLIQQFRNSTWTSF